MSDILTHDDEVLVRLPLDMIEQLSNWHICRLALRDDGTFELEVTDDLDKLTAPEGAAS